MTSRDHASYADPVEDTRNSGTGSGSVSGKIVGRLGPATFLVQPGGSGTTHCAEMAMFQHCSLSEGDRVLIQPDQHGQYFITGRIGAVPLERPDLQTSAGARACIRSRDGREQLQIRDCRDRVIFEYDPTEGKGCMTLDAEHLRLNARQSIDLSAGSDLRLFSGRETDIHSLGFTRLATASGAATRIDLGPQALQIRTKNTQWSSEQFNVRFDRGRVQGEQLATKLDSLRLNVEKIETIATRMIERLGDAFRKVKGLSQLDTGRSRTLCRDSHTVKAGRVRLEGDEAVKIQSDKIHLG